MNVLFICTDQQRASDVGFMGNEVVQTPHLDALATESMVFENAWVSNPSLYAKSIDYVDWPPAFGSWSNLQ